MKKAIVATSAIISLVSTTVTYAAGEIVNVQPPTGKGIAANTGVGTVITNIINLVFIVAILLVLFMLISGAITWITSSGDKEKVGQARGRIINALIGLAILALAFLILNVAGNLINFNLSNLQLNPLNTPNP
ncbi:pilin [Patescibacteria group bacterium]|nr:pilin [Patescibacteria group bacterium]MCL5410182.1 pilin [Patescibacteria group bacterium]